LRHIAFAADNLSETIKELKNKGIDSEEIRVDEFTEKKIHFYK